ncbi:MAG TPA: hypothetical protein VME20_03960 [Acidimicrobiales bacterium]|nr:hypothetical protein [Acidimicrobiales bacterium]
MASFSRLRACWAAPLLTFLGTALVVPLTWPQVASAQGATVSSVIASAKGAITKQTGVHLLVYSHVGSSVESLVGDLGVKRGIETITQNKDTVTIELTPSYAYVKGNEPGLTSIMGFSASQAKKIGNEWVSVKAGTSQYTSLASGLDTSSLAGLLPDVKGTTLSVEKAKPVDLFLLKWTSAATSSSPQLTHTLTLAAVGDTLPVEQSTVAANGSTETAAFSKWGEAVRVSAPPARSTIPYSTLAS